MALHFFQSDECLELDGHKDSILGMPSRIYEPEQIFIAAADGRGNPLKNPLPDGSKVRRGTLLGLRAPDDFPIYSPISGTLTGHRTLSAATGRDGDYFVIASDHKGDLELKTPLKPASECSVEEILAAIKDSGAVGFGGAGFPTYRKYNSGKPMDALIINAAECEPYLANDIVYGKDHVSSVFAAIPYLLKVSQAKKVYFAVKEERKTLVGAVSEAIRNHPELPVSLALLPNRYPMGYERTLVTFILHRSYDVLPSEAGAIVNNLFTYSVLGERFTEGKIPGLRCITVSGAVGNPGTIITPFGTLASELIAFAGGITAKGDYKVISGGPMCGDTTPKDYVLAPQNNGILVLEAVTLRAEPCWHCGDCCLHCPMDLQPVEIQMALKKNDVARMISLQADKCCSCGICSFVCPCRIEVTANVIKAKTIVANAKLASMKPKEGK